MYVPLHRLRLRDPYSLNVPGYKGHAFLVPNDLCPGNLLNVDV